MSLTAPNTSTVPVEWIGDLSPTLVLDEDIVVRLWLVRNAIGQEMLAYLADEQPGEDWIVLSPAGPNLVASLKDGTLPLRDALTATWMWLVRRTHEGTLSAWSVDAATLGDIHLPRPGARLRWQHVRRPGVD
jgi:WD40 repeat protein